MRSRRFLIGKRVIRWTNGRLARWANGRLARWESVLRWGRPLVVGLAACVGVLVGGGGLALHWALNLAGDWLEQQQTGPLQVASAAVVWRGIQVKDVAVGDVLRVRRVTVGLNPLSETFGTVTVEGLAARLDWREGRFDLEPWQRMLPPSPPALAGEETSPVLPWWLGSLLRRVVIDGATATIGSAYQPLVVSLDADMTPGGLLWDWQGSVALSAIAPGCSYPGWAEGMTGRLDLILTASGGDGLRGSRRTSGMLSIEAGSGQVRVPDGVLENADISLSGPASWHDGRFHLAINEGHGATHRPARLRGYQFDHGFAWALQPTAEDSEADGLSVRLREDGTVEVSPGLTVASPELALLLPSGHRLLAQFAAARLEGTVTAPPTPTAVLTAALDKGTVRLWPDDGHSLSTTPPSSSPPARTPEQELGLLLLTDVQAEVRRQGFASADEVTTLRTTADVRRLPGEGASLGANTAALRPFHLTLDDEGRGDQPHSFRAEITDASGRRLLVGRGQHDMETGIGQARVEIPPLRFDPEGLQPSHLHSGLATAISSASGQIGAAGRLAWTPHGVTSDLKLALQDLTLVRGFLRLQRINGVIEITQPWPTRTPEHQVVSVEVIQAGFPLNDGTASFHLDGKGSLFLEGAALSLAGGTLSVLPTALPLDKLQGTVTVQLDGVSLAKLADYAQISGLSATGSLGGQFPVVLAESDILIRDGVLTATQAGSLQYRPTHLPPMFVGKGMAVDLMLRALSDFQYQTLRLTLSGSAGGDMQLGLHVRGANPAVYSGYPLEFNLTLQGALSQVIGSSLYTYQVPERIRDRVEQILHEAASPEATSQGATSQEATSSGASPKAQAAPSVSPPPPQRPSQ